MFEMPVEVDARNLLCPLPVIRTQDAVAGLPAGTEVVVRCTDPGALLDIPAWCRINGHELLSAREIDGEVEVRLRTVAQPPAA